MSKKVFPSRTRESLEKTLENNKKTFVELFKRAPFNNDIKEKNLKIATDNIEVTLGRIALLDGIPQQIANIPESIRMMQVWDALSEISNKLKENKKPLKEINEISSLLKEERNLCKKLYLILETTKR
jgi:hypothetical protein